jgi:hypothetical protein
MTSQDGANAPRAGATAAQLKHDIDSGLTGDKVGGFDPAAAPLGADDEAAGTPPSPADIAQARAQERTGRNSATANAATPALQPDARLPPQPGVAWWGAAGVLVAVALGFVLLALL